MSSLTIAGFPYLESKSVLADLDRLLLADSQTNMWNQKQIAFVELIEQLTGAVESVNGYTGEVSLSLFDLNDIPGEPSAGTVLTWNGTALVWVSAEGASGETNLMSNVGTGGAISVYKQKTSVTFELNGVLGKEGIESTLSGNNIELIFKVSTLTSDQKTALASALISDIRSGISVEQLNNTTITDPQIGDVLTWNGTIWINQASTGGTPFSIASLSAVTTGDALNDYLAIYSNSLTTHKKITPANLAILMGTTADASVSVKGLTKLSVAPATSNNPIAVGDNDPRLTRFGYDAIIAASGGTHTSLTTAINAGCERILIRSGTYTETVPNALSIGKNLYIDCDSAVTVNITAGASDEKYLSVNGAIVQINGGKWNITTSRTAYSTFYFVKVTSTASQIDLKNMRITYILNEDVIGCYTIGSSVGGEEDTFHIENCVLKVTLGTATRAGYLAGGSGYNTGVQVGCTLINIASGGTISAQFDGVKSVGCFFRADGSGTIRNRLYLSNAVNCFGWYSRDCSLREATNCYLSGNNQTSDATYDVGQTNFRAYIGGRISGCTVSSSLSNGNGFKIDSGSVVTGSRFEGGQHIQIGTGDTNYNLVAVVTGCSFSMAMGQSSINSTVSIKQKFSTVIGNNFEFNYLAGGSVTAVITIESTANYSHVSQNNFHNWSSSIPSITDSSTGSVKVDNLFYNTP